MGRRPDWGARLEAYLQVCAGRRFEYGVFDCALFAAGAIEVQTGQDWAASVRGRYRSRAELLTLAERLTGERSVYALGSQVLSGLPSVPVGFAQRGDVLAIARAGGRDCSFGVLSLDGRHIWAAARLGLMRLPLRLAVGAWRV
jgi:uncharacterized protein DUF6950